MSREIEYAERLVTWGDIPLTVLPIRGDEWITPYHRVPESECGAARLRRSYYRRDDIFRMEGVAGYGFFQPVRRRMPVMMLQRRGEGGRWKTWMVDDPTHWLGMKELVDRMPGGRILCAGLGLGLMLHHLAAREDVEAVTVVEMERDVIDLIGPLAPEYLAVAYEHADFYEYIARGGARGHDAILWDLAVGGPEETGPAFLHSFAQCAYNAPGVPLFQFGLLDGRDHVFDSGRKGRV